MKCTLLCCVLFFFISLYFCSCQKELGEPVVPIPIHVGKLLVKVTGIKGDSSIIVNYEYDSSSRIIAQQITLTVNKNTTIYFKRYDRDKLGRIATIAEITKHNSSASDTVYTYVYYPNSATTNFSYTTSRIGVMGTTTKDSTVFTYDSNRVISSFSYLIDSLQSAPLLNSKWEYNYDNNSNLISKKLFTYIWGDFVPVTAYQFSYDTTINPLPMGNEFILMKGNSSRNNISSIEITDPANSVNKSLITRTYSLNIAGKPDKGYEKVLSSESYTYSYYYR